MGEIWRGVLFLVLNFLLLYIQTLMVTKILTPY